MNSPVHSFAWRFGGPLGGLPPLVAWTLLGIVGVLGAVWIVVSYRRTLVALAPSPRRILVTLRLLLWAGLLLALAGPTRVERTYAKKETRPLAVLVDQSASMTTPDNRRQRRIDDALRQWRLLAPAAQAAHGQPRVFAFADSPAPVAIAAASVNADLPATQTRLFASLDRLLADAPPGGWGGIVALTDGLDTTATTAADALAATTRTALAAGTPFYLLPGRNRYAGGAFLTLRELTVPAQVPPRSSFRLEVTLDSYQPAARDLPLRLKVGDTWREPEVVRLDAGRRALAWSADIPADAPGTLAIELVAGSAPDAPRARAEVRIAAPTSTRILYYQGALDWGYRFLADILRRDPAFTLMPIFNLAPVGSARPRATPAGALPRLPDVAAGYDAFDVVVLANATAAQLSSAQQTALSTWVRGGGVLLFLAPDDAASHSFAGSEVEKMLPVVFGSGNTAQGEDPAVAAFRQNMRQVGGAHTDSEARFDSEAARATRTPPLSTFAWEPRAAVLFGTELTQAAPRFANYARVRRAKPGAEVLARHPADPAPEGDERAILLALQRYGRGQTAVLTSDALWRWKLDQPSRERGVEIFWQNLFAWLGRERQRGVRFERAPLLTENNRELTLRLVGASGLLTLSARRDDSAVDTAQSLLPAGEDGPARLFTWTPPADGSWVIEARLGADLPVRHWITVATSPGGETSGVPPDEGLLRALAERTGGAVLAGTAPSAWRTVSAEADAQLLRETTEPLWHQAWIFAALLSVYAVELVLRRRQRLL